MYPRLEEGGSQLAHRWLRFDRLRQAELDQSEGQHRDVQVLAHVHGGRQERLRCARWDLFGRVGRVLEVKRGALHHDQQDDQERVWHVGYGASAFHNNHLTSKGL